MSDVVAVPSQDRQVNSFIGKAVHRTEDDRLLRGEGSFVDDVPEPPGVLHAAFVRSPHAHARILSIDVAKAKALEGVVAVVCGTDLAEVTDVGVIHQEDGPSLTMETMPTRKVRFVGDIVACVIARDRYIAEDGVDLVQVDYEVLSPNLDMFAATTPADEPVDPDLDNNLHTHVRRQYGNTEEAFRSADRVVEVEIRSARQTHVPIETRGLLAVWDRGRRLLTVHTGQQTTHVARTRLASRLRLAEHQVRIVSPDVGGAFGQKIPVYREDIVVGAMAMQLNRPVKWLEDRNENLLASTHARDEAVFLQAAVTNQGRILGVRAALWADLGAYAYFPPSYMLDVVGWMIPGAYNLKNYEYTLNVALTNKCPAGPMRAPMSIVTLVTESLMEETAATLGVPVAAIRDANLIRDDQYPYTTACEYVYEALSIERCYDLASGKAESIARPRMTEEFLYGSALANVVEPTTYGSAWYRRALGSGSGHETARMRIDPSGTVTVSVGINPSGQGYETSIAQVVAETLGMGMERVRVLLGDTAIAPYGMGSRGSRGAVAGHGVAVMAAEKLRGLLVDACASLHQYDPSELLIQDGKILEAGTGVEVDTVARLAWVFHMDPSSLPPGVPPGLDITVSFDPPPMTFSNATHVAEVAVHRKTGRVDVVSYEVWEDAGTVVNPRIVDGQVQGGVAMGIGQATLEEVVYDARGNNTSSTFVDYLIPLVENVPRVHIHHIETPHPTTPKGMKGMSEGPVMGATAAVTLAVQNAIRQVNPMARANPLPLHPARVLSLIRGDHS